MPRRAERYTVHSLARGLAILERFTHGPLRLTDLSATLRVDKATLFRYCTTLSDLGYLHMEPSTKEYRLGPMARALGFAALVESDLLGVIQTWLRPLAERFRGTASFGVLDGTEVVYVARAVAEHSLTYAISVGGRRPAVTSSMGKVLIAALNESDRSRLIDSDHLASRARAKLERELESAREKGYALNLGGFQPGLNSIAVPLRDALSGGIYGALNVASVDLDERRLIRDVAPALSDVAARVQRRESYTGTGIQI